MRPLAFQLYSDPRVDKFLGGTPAETIEEERGRLERHTERLWDKFDHGLMAAFLKEDGSFIGFCGLLRWEIDAVAETEVAYALVPEAWGNGYATEAANALADDAFTRLGRKRIISLVLPENTASINVALKKAWSSSGRPRSSVKPLLSTRERLLPQFLDDLVEQFFFVGDGVDDEDFCMFVRVLWINCNRD